MTDAIEVEMKTVDDLRAERDALPDAQRLLDLPGRAQEDVWLQRRVLDARIHHALVMTDRLKELDPQIAQLTTWIANLNTWRARLCAELLTSPPQSQQGLKISIVCVDRGFDFHNECYPPDLQLFALMTAAGYVPRADESWNIWSGGHGPLQDATRRLGELQKQRDEVQARLESVLRDPVTV